MKNDLNLRIEMKIKRSLNLNNSLVFSDCLPDETISSLTNNLSIYIYMLQ